MAVIAGSLVLLLGADGDRSRSAAMSALGRSIAVEEARFSRFQAGLQSGETAADSSVDPEGERAYYEPSLVDYGFTIEEGSRAALLLNLAVRMEGAGLSGVTFATRDGVRRYAPPFGPLEHASVGDLAAAATVAERLHRGAEFDTLVRDQEGLLAVTARHDLDGELRVESRRLAAPPDPSVAAPRDWVSRFGVEAPRSGSAKWSSRQLALLAEALSLLRPHELRAIEGLGFRREVAPPSEHAEKAALYRTEGSERWIELYDLVFAHGDRAFVGDIDRPRAPELRVILHEVGHAVSMSRGHAIAREYHTLAAALPRLADGLNTLGVRVTSEELEVLRGYRSRIEGLAERLQNTSPAVGSAVGRSDELGAFRAASGRGVTPYGRVSLGEAYAEAFALALVDPAALERVDPAALAFFSSRGSAD